MDHVHKPVSESAEFHLVKVNTKTHGRKSTDSGGLKVEVCGICGSLYCAEFVGHFKNSVGTESK
jgi:hypothetical protein